MPPPALNLSGLWQGRFSYPRGRPPTSFVADLAETDCWIVGLTEEIAAVGDARGRKISASLQGRRTGRSVTWLKLYDASSRNYDTVHYAGEVSNDGSEIAGRWTIPGGWSGTFLMIRSARADLAATRETVEQIGRF
jgi:hypothetical protein